MSQNAERSWVLPTSIIFATSTLFLLFVFLYPVLFPFIESARPKYFARNVSEAMSEGSISRAVRIAHHATQRRPYDPSAYTIYGRLLLERGKTSEALQQLDKAVDIQMEENRGGLVETRTPYYYAPARLSLGKYYLDHGRPIKAVEQFELARPYADLTDQQYAGFRHTLYAAYSSQGLWGRALEFSRPLDIEADTLDEQDLLRVATTCEGEEYWDLAKQIAPYLQRSGALAAEGYYLVGRASLVQKRYQEAITNLERAASLGHTSAQFYLGVAFEQSNQSLRAIQAYLHTAAGSTFRLFALGRALSLMTALPSRGQTTFSESRDALLGELDREIATLKSTSRIQDFSKYARFVPLGMRAPDFARHLSCPFPMVVLWADTRQESSSLDNVDSSRPKADNSPIQVIRGRNVVRLQWVKNLVYWAGAESALPVEHPVPGWIDSARDWYGLRPDYAVQVRTDTSGNAALRLTGVTWMYSTPAGVPQVGDYILTSRFKGSSKKARLGLQFMNDQGETVFENTILDSDSLDGWTPYTGYVRSPIYASSVRVQITILPGATSEDFDEIMLVAIDEPSGAFQNMDGLTSQPNE